MSRTTIPAKWDETSKRADAEQMLSEYAAAAQSDAGVSAASIRGFVDPAYAADHSFYLLVVPMLSRCFPAVTPSTTRELGLAFYGIFRMVLAMDRVADRQESSYLFDGLVHYTVALRRLSAVFPADSAVWKRLTDRIRYSVDQIRLERNLCHRGGSDLGAFVSVAMGKSSLIQLTVDWLDAIQPVGELADRLRSSLLKKHLGMQWLDDINDFSVDVEQGQSTYARSRLHAFAIAHQLDLASLTPAKQKRLLFASGLGEELLDEASQYFALALAELDGIELPDYAEIVLSYINQTGRIRNSLADERAAAANRVAERKANAQVAG
jgi:hypothetical protein